MNSLTTSTATSTNGESTAHDLFALTDEQILEIQPEPQDFAVSGNGSATDEGSRAVAPASLPAGSSGEQTRERLKNGAAITPSAQATQAEMTVPLEPPLWLAAQMKDPWAGEEAREFWNGVQQARTEAAAYRAAIASPEDARALKELYAGGVGEARSAAERARLLDDIDRAYFGAAGTTPEQTSASRAQLAQRMLREDPAAFREMVVAGLRALEEAEKGSSVSPSGVTPLPRLAQVLAAQRYRSDVVAQHPAPLQSGSPTIAASIDGRPSEEQTGAHLAAYAAFERSANEELERSVGSAIERTLEQALPATASTTASGQAGVHRTAPIRERLTASVRTEIEKALQGDRQLGEQVAQVLSSRNFNDDARAHVVRLIRERAQQLVPGAAKRVLNEWTQTTLAAHRSRTQRNDMASARADVAMASVPARPAGSEKTQTRRQDASRNPGPAGATGSQRVNYRKLSDEQILDMT